MSNACHQTNQDSQQMLSQTTDWIRMSYEHGLYEDSDIKLPLIYQEYLDFHVIYSSCVLLIFLAAAILFTSIFYRFISVAIKSRNIYSEDLDSIIIMSSGVGFLLCWATSYSAWLTLITIYSAPRLYLLSHMMDIIP